MRQLDTVTKNASDLDKLELDLERDIYRESYYEFYKKAFAQLHPGDHYDENWHAQYLCSVLQKEAIRIKNKERKEKDIIINVPFRSSKSLIVTIIWPVWCWACVDPSMKFITVSYSGNLAIEHSSKSRDLINSQWFQRLFNHVVQLKHDTQAKGHYETVATGVRKAVGTGGQITGSGGDVIICDDPQDPQQAVSEVERKNTKDFYDHTLHSRLNDSDVGVRIVVMQRLHEDDLTGHLMNKKTGRPESHFHICIPGELDKLEKTIVRPIELREKYVDGLFWHRFHREKLADHRKTLGELQYAGQINQLPAPLEGNLVKRGWFKIIQANLVERNPSMEPVYFFLDTAYTEKTVNDPSGILACFVRKGVCYIVNIAEVWKIFPDLVPFVIAYVKLNDYSNGGSMVWVEPKASGKSLVQVLRKPEVSDLNVGEIESDLVNGKDKIGRLSFVSPYVMSGRVCLVEGEWNDFFLTQVCSFPNATHDEFVDLLCYMIDTLLIRGIGGNSLGGFI